MSLSIESLGILLAKHASKEDLESMEFILEFLPRAALAVAEHWVNYGDGDEFCQFCKVGVEWRDNEYCTIEPHESYCIVPDCQRIAKDIKNRKVVISK